MQSNLFELIDLLVKMSGSNSNIDELKADLEDTESKISRIEKKLSDLEEEMVDEKYFDASSEIVDRNIKISLVNKLQKYHKIKSDLEDELEKVKEEERKLHNELTDINEELSSANKYTDTINKNNGSSEAFASMIASENNRITKLVERKENIDTEYNKIQKKVEYLAESLNDIDVKIKREEERLNEIDENLSNIKSYINVEAKEEDEQNYLNIKNELDSLIAHKNDIKEDPVFISGLIKENIANDKKDEVENEFSHLIEIVKSIPYMDLENDQIAVEMQKLDDELKSYDESISNKEYQTLDAIFIDERISYLDEDLKNIKDRLSEISNRKKSILNENDLLSSKVFNGESQIETIDNSLKDYENYDYENSELPKSVVAAAYNKLLEERKNIYTITNNYRKDLLNNLNGIKICEEQEKALNEEYKEKEIELDELNKKIALNTKSRNVLEEAKDKLMLDKINNKILCLKNREQFKKSISSILDEFEMLISSLEFVDKKTRVQRNFNEVLDIPEKEETLDEEISESKLEEPIINEVKPEIHPINENIKEEEKEDKLRVVEIIPINEDLPEKEKEKDFMVNDFQDDDYVDINTLINNEEGN